jgi:hypothetical protein
MQRPALLNRFNLSWNLAGMVGGGVLWASGGHLGTCCAIAGACMVSGAGLVALLLPPGSRHRGDSPTGPRAKGAAAAEGGSGSGSAIQQAPRSVRAVLTTVLLLWRDPLTRWTLVLAAVTPPFEVRDPCNRVVQRIHKRP